MINPKRELFVWGPIEGVLHYPWYFCIAIVKMFPKTYRVYWPEIVFSFSNHKMTFICEYAALRKAGWEVAERWVLPKPKYALVRFRFDRAVEKLLALNQQIISQIFHNPPLHNPLQLPLNLRGRDRPRPPLKVRGGRPACAGRGSYADLYRQWKEAYLDFWLHGLVPEIANWGQEKFLMDALKRRGLKGQEYLHALEVLSAPSELGFFQEEEKDLLKIAIEYPLLISPSKRGRKRLVSPPFKGGVRGGFGQALQEHQRKYFWLHNSYYGSKVLTVADFAKRFKEVTKKGSIRERIRAIEQAPKDRARAKEQMIKKLGFSKLEANVAHKLGQTISWQDERKKYIWQANHIIDLFLQEAARRAKVPFQMCKDLLPEEFERIFAGKKVNVRMLSKQRQLSAVYLKKNILTLKVRSAARTLVALFVKQEAKSVKEVRGLVVSRGLKVRGRVRLIFSPQKEHARMKRGDVLVTAMTSPEFIVVMKKAAAIVTDTGGMTSHAAVVSRELGVPCIVGTKVATQVFKDGDLVEVNTEKGIVRKLS